MALLDKQGYINIDFTDFASSSAKLRSDQYGFGKSFGASSETYTSRRAEIYRYRQSMEAKICGIGKGMKI